MGLDFVAIVLFLLPPYVANAAPVVFGGKFPVDMGATAWDGRRFLGDGKTWKGLIVGITSGVLVGYAEAFVTGNSMFAFLALLSSTGAMLGDMLGSFIKRRLDYERGRPSLLMDQLLFIIFAFILSYPVLESILPQVLVPESIVIILFATYVLHRIMNIIANKLGLKKVPW
ncbi:MAG: CDP-2,3-bis-(O-geranylgeranyl)-sn-glycerol synthase [Candidatus Micrarchaeota archaeon]|nr:CDP-2,3-bis-(O-geranylgeranyl)-sn-glycerol synthase [Candidatus Micrarchaeota archaeon]